MIRAVEAELLSMIKNPNSFLYNFGEDYNISLSFLAYILRKEMFSSSLKVN